MTSTSAPPIRDLYLQCAASMAAFYRSIEDDDASRPVPCTPEWTVRDVLSHVVGLCEDGVAGRWDGLGSDEATAEQVRRNRAVPAAHLLAQWESQAEAFAAAIDERGYLALVYDCAAHEQDLRHALDLPGQRDLPVVGVAGRNLAARVAVDFPLEVEVDGHIRTNEHPDLGREPHLEVVLRDMTDFEVFRSRLGRRSRAQVEAYHWTGPPERVAAVVDEWFLLGPSRIDIHE